MPAISRFALLSLVLSVVAYLSFRQPEPRAAPLTLSRLMQQTHFAFRADPNEGQAWAGGHVTYASHVDEQGVTFTPYHGATQGSVVHLASAQVSRGLARLGETSLAPRLTPEQSLEVERGEFTERLENRAEGLEQSWAFEHAPAGQGDLEVRLHVGATFTGETPTGLHFSNGHLGMRYGRATWVDARGTATPVETSWQDEAIVMRVPAALLEASRYPAVLDPLVSPESGIDTPVYIAAPSNQLAPAMGSNGTSYLAAWVDQRNGGGRDIYAARIDSTGTLLDPAAISLSIPGDSSNDAPAIASDGSNFLVVFSRAVGSANELRGVRLSSSGTVLDASPFLIANSGALSTDSAAVAWGGGTYLVTWHDADPEGSLASKARAIRVSSSGTATGTAFDLTSNASDYTSVDFDGTRFLAVWAQSGATVDIWATFVSTAGVPSTPFAITTSAGHEMYPSIAWSGSSYLVAWRDSRGGAGSEDIYAARVSTTGTVADSNGFVVCNASGPQQTPAVSKLGTGYYVTWADNRAAPFDIYGAVVSSTAAVTPSNGTSIASNAGSQIDPAIAGNGSNVFVSWVNWPNAGNSDIFGTIVLSNGTVQTPQGSIVATAANAQTTPALSYNGTNYLAIWADSRSGASDVYAVRLSTTGTPLESSAFVVSNAAGNQAAPAVAWANTTWVAAWQDDRDGGSNIYGARITGSGAVSDPSGILISGAANDQLAPAVAFDGTNALVVWQDGRTSTTTPDIYGARVSPSTGTVADTTGVAINTQAGAQRNPSVASNGVHSLVTWESTPSSVVYVYGARVSPSMAVAEPTGFAIHASGSNNHFHPAVSSMSGAFFVTWSAVNGLTTDIYGTRVSGAGTVLDSTPITINSATGDQNAPSIANDGTNYQVVWEDKRSGNTDVYGARVSSAGAVLDSNGFVISNATTEETRPVVAASSLRNFVVAYQAFSVGSTTNTTRIRVRTLTNAPPSATPLSVSTPEDQPLFIPLTATDADGDAVTISLVSMPAHGTLSGAPPDFTYTPATNYNGPDSFTFKANDTLVDSPTSTVSITVQPVNDAPVATPQMVTTAEDTALDVTLSGTDLDGATTLTFTVIAQPLHGTLTGVPPVVHYQPTANYNGPDSFTFRASDGALSSVDATVSITVTPVNDAPVAATQSLATAEDTPLPLTLSATDVETSVLSYAIVASPPHGTLTGTPPNLVYTPAPNYFGGDSFVFTASDGTATSANQTIFLTVSAVNDVPVAIDQSLNTPQDTQLTITLTATDVESDLLTYEVVSFTAHGTLTGTTNQRIYQPVSGYRGPDSFTFVARDGQGTSLPASVNISVAIVNHVPTTASQMVTTDEDTPITINVVATDVDADPLTYALVDQPQHGTLTGTGPTYQYTPAPNFNGSDVFHVKTNDGTFDSPAATIAITVRSVNDAPAATPQTVNASEDLAVTIVLTGTDGDLNTTLTYTVVDQPAHGTLSGNAPNLTYTPSPNFNGSDSLTFKVNDGTTDSPNATVAIIVAPVNDAPVAQGQSLGTAFETPVAITLAATDQDGDTLTYSIATQPAHGSLSSTPTTVTYTPAEGYSGTDSFTFTASDGTATSNAATVTIVVERGADPQPTGPGATPTPTKDTAHLNGWSCGCSEASAGSVSWLVLALLLVRRRPGVALALAAALTVGTAAHAKPATKKAKTTKTTPAAPAPVPAPTPEPVATPAPSPAPAPAPPPPAGPASLAALGVVVTVPNEKLDASAFTEMLVSSIAQTKLFKVISAADIATMLGVERQRQMLGCAEDSCLTEISAALGSHYLLQGQVGKVGDNYLVTVRLIDAQTSKLLGRSALQTTETSLLLSLVWQAVQDAVDAAATNLPPEQAKTWADRPRAQPPTSVTTQRASFGVALYAVGGYQPLADVGSRASVGGQVDVTLRIGRFDVGAGVVISPTPGARVTIAVALLQSRSRLSLGLRGSGFFGPGLYGGGPVAVYEFALTPHWGLTALVAGEVYAGAASPVVAVLGGLGADAHF